MVPKCQLLSMLNVKSVNLRVDRRRSKKGHKIVNVLFNCHLRQSAKMEMEKLNKAR